MMWEKQTVIKTAANLGDACTLGVTVCAVSAWLPPIAALLSIIWLAIRIGDWAYIRFIKKAKDKKDYEPID